MFVVPDVALREVLGQPVVELEQTVPRRIVIHPTSTEVRLVTVDLDCDLQVRIGEVEAEPT